MTVRSPTDQLINASSIGEARYVLSTTEVRSAEILATARAFDTAGGVVIGAAGDIGVTGYGREQWPVQRNVFLGSYLILGRVADYLVAQRLVHVRLAWTIECDGASFVYPDRGVVAAERDGWLYQSDETDFGYLHPDVKLVGHEEVGPHSEVHRRNWSRLVALTDNLLAIAPPVLSLLALLAFFSQAVVHDIFLGRVFAAIEAIVLLIGAGLVYRMHRGRWLLKSIVESGQALCVAFQDAVALLGDIPSPRFPAMALWRAAQRRELHPEGPVPPLPIDPEREIALRRCIAVTLRELRQKTHAHSIERFASPATLWAFAIIVAVNATLVLGLHLPMLEVVAIWLPSVIGTAHAFALRHRFTEQSDAATELSKVLTFVQTRLYETLPIGDAADHREANLRLLCRAIAGYSQRGLQRAIASEPSIPV